MVNLKKFLKPYKDAGAFHALFAPHRFIDDSVFLTKSNQLGVVLGVEGIDDECLTEATLETYTKRVAAAWRSFDERFRLYQYVIKQDHAPVEHRTDYPNPAVRQTVQDRRAYLSRGRKGCIHVAPDLRSVVRAAGAGAEQPVTVAPCQTGRF